jgi:hypothetical protein
MAGEDITDRPRNDWIIDFGVGMAREAAEAYELPFEFVRRWVYPKRAANRRKAHALRWWLFGDARPGMRSALVPLPRYLATPMTSKHRIWSFVDSSILPLNSVAVVASDSYYMFGVLQSRAHEVWSRRVASQLREAESGQREAEALG